MEPFLPENRPLDNVIDLPAPGSGVDAATIARTACSVTRALHKSRIDRRRASLFHYGLQTMRNVLRHTHPRDPALPAATYAINELTLALTSKECSGRGPVKECLGRGTTSVVPERIKY
jgi:hypothetical protein